MIEYYRQEDGYIWCPVCSDTFPELEFYPRKLEFFSQKSAPHGCVRTSSYPFYQYDEAHKKEYDKNLKKIENQAYFERKFSAN